jgi:ABC-type lipoprotein release transport system permease subunit
VDLGGILPGTNALKARIALVRCYVRNEKRLIAGLLYGVEPHDTATFAMTTLALGSIASLACVVPALNAALVDPVTALRAE